LYILQKNGKSRMCNLSLLTIPKILAIHDLSSYGRAALTVVTPVLSSMGLQVIPLPTAVLSSHGAIPGYHKVDLTYIMRPFLQHWQQAGIRFDTIYSGYLASYQQIDIVSECFSLYLPDTQILVDPVLGDNGKLYGSIQANMVSGMQLLIKQAHIITPNVTEAYFLLSKPYQAFASWDQYLLIAKALSQMGPYRVIITGIRMNEQDSQMHILVYEASTQDYKIYSNNFVNAGFPGTGDVFASALLGYLYRNYSFFDAANAAFQFVNKCVNITYNSGNKIVEGLVIEPLLHLLNNTTTL